MSWAGITSSQLVTWDNLKDAVLNSVFESKVAYNSIPSGNEIVTKQNVEDYIYVNVGASPWSGYASNRCPPKSAFVVNNVCTDVSISFSDIISSTGNTSYPDGTVYVVTADGTFSYTSPGNYTLCTRPATSVPSSEYIYYYAYDSIQYFTVSTIGFYPSAISCSTSGCVPSSYSTLYDAFTCAGCTGGGSSVTLYSNSTPAWVVGTRVFDSSGNNVSAGRYTYGGKCYNVQIVNAVYNIYKYDPNTPWTTYTVPESQVVSVTNC